MNRFLIIITLCFCFNANAQDTIVISSPEFDSIHHAEIKAAYYVDSSNSLDIAQVKDRQFVKIENGERVIQKKHAWKEVTGWSRLYIRNNTNKKLELFLILPRGAIYYLYVDDGSTIRSIKAAPGFYMEMDPNSYRANRISIEPGATIAAYAKFVDPGKNRFSSNTLLTGEQLWLNYAANDLYAERSFFFTNVVFLVIIFFIIIHTLAQYFFNGRKEFLLYAFYTSAVFLYFFYKFDDNTYTDIIFGHFPYIQKHANNSLSYLVYYGYYMFVLRFIDFKAIAHWFYRVIVFTGWLLLASIVLDILFIFTHLLPLKPLLFNIVRVYLLITGFTGIYLLIRSRNKQAYFIAIGSTCLLVGALISMLFSWKNISYISPHFDSLIFIKAGMVLELLCFTAGLGYKSSLIEKEKIQAQQQVIALQKEMLERGKEQQLTLEFKKKLMEMELQLLKSQLNPHFYFNTLNNLYGLTIIDPKKAPDAILKLSDIMEYVIYDCKSEKVPLEKELKFLNSYIELEKLRYDDNSRIRLRLEGNGQGKFISPLLLIQFIENAFKHGMEEGRTDDYLEVNISIEKNQLHYSSVNKVNGKAMNSNGIGLANVQKRLAMLYPGHTLLIDNNGSTFKVDLELKLE